MLFNFSQFYLKSQQISRILAFKSTHKLAVNQSKCLFTTSIRYSNKNDDSKARLKEKPSSESNERQNTEKRTKAGENEQASSSRSERLKRLRESGFVKLNDESSKLKKQTSLETTFKRPLGSDSKSVDKSVERKESTIKPRESQSPSPSESAALRLARLIDNLKPIETSEKLLKPIQDVSQQSAKKSNQMPKLGSRIQDRDKTKQHGSGATAPPKPQLDASKSKETKTQPAQLQTEKKPQTDKKSREPTKPPKSSEQPTVNPQRLKPSQEKDQKIDLTRKNRNIKENTEASAKGDRSRSTISAARVPNTQRPTSKSPTARTPFKSREKSQMASNAISQESHESAILSKLIDYNKEQSLYSGKGLSIFDIDKLVTNDGKVLLESPIWSEYNDQEFSHQQKIPFRNAYEEMIELTNDGKLWHFPINNEQGIDESEASVPFFEHIFLDHHLEEFPDIEPIQEFMTLVLNGLSKNSHISVDEKNEIIKWYKDYFNEKLDIIKEALIVEQNELKFAKPGRENSPSQEKTVIKNESHS